MLGSFYTAVEAAVCVARHFETNQQQSPQPANSSLTSDVQFGFCKSPEPLAERCPVLSDDIQTKMEVEPSDAVARNADLDADMEAEADAGKGTNSLEGGHEATSSCTSIGTLPRGGDHRSSSLIAAGGPGCTIHAMEDTGVMCKDEIATAESPSAATPRACKLELDAHETGLPPMASEVEVSCCCLSNHCCCVATSI